MSEINKALIQGVSLRNIAKLAAGDAASPASVKRHRDVCIPAQLGPVIEERHRDVAIRTLDHVEENLAMAQELRNFAEAYAKQYPDGEVTAAIRAALDGVKTVNSVSDLRAKLLGEHQQDKPNESEEQRALKAAQFALLAQTGPRCETREDWAELVDKMIGLAPVLKGRREEIIGWWDK